MKPRETPNAFDALIKCSRLTRETNKLYTYIYLASVE